jgi:hypothetical protein
MLPAIEVMVMFLPDLFSIPTSNLFCWPFLISEHYIRS